MENLTNVRHVVGTEDIVMKQNHFPQRTSSLFGEADNQQVQHQYFRR